MLIGTSLRRLSSACLRGLPALTPSLHEIRAFDEANFPVIIIDCPKTIVIAVTQHMIAMHMIDARKLVGVSMLSSIDANLGEYGTIEVATSPECPLEIPSSPQDPVSITSNSQEGLFQVVLSS